MAFRSVRALALCGALVALSAHAQDVPHSLALMVMLKVLTYDATFSSRGAGDFVVLVPFGAGDEAKAAAAVDIASGMELRTINGRTLKFIAVPAAELAGGAKASAVLLHSGMPLAAARDAVAAAGRSRLYSLAFDEALVRDAAAMLSVASNAGRPQVVLHIGTARAIGAEFGPSVLKVARTVQ
jgi:hypothetical protein